MEKPAKIGKRGVGRKPGRRDNTKKLSKAVKQRILLGLQYGLKENSALLAGYAGVSPFTMYSWRKRGEAAQALEDADQFVPDSEVPYLNLHKDMKAAISECALRSLQTLEQAIEGFKDQKGTFIIPPSYHAALAKLERLFPDDYGRKDKIEHSTNPDAPFQMNIVVETKKERDARYKRYFDGLENESKQASEGIPGTDSSGQSVLQTETDEKANRIPPEN